MSRALEFLTFLSHNMINEGAVIIKPSPNHFRSSEDELIELLRKHPADINVQHGTDPFAKIKRGRGRWAVMWIPENKR